MTTVFLSYTHSDKAIDRRLATWLRLADVSVWIDEVEIGIGESLIERVAEGIKEAGGIQGTSIGLLLDLF